MLVRIGQLERVGRFTSWDCNAARRDEVRFQKLTIVYGRNAAGKSTLARLLAAAASADAEEVALDQTLGTDELPRLTLELDSGLLRFDGEAWKGPKPKIAVFDRTFIEQNAHVGRRSSKAHRKELLRLALGREDVAYAQQLDELSIKRRDLTAELKPHTSTIAAAAAACGMSERDFTALKPVADIDAAAAEVERDLKDAQRAAEIAKHPQPCELPRVPSLDFEAMSDLLRRTVSRIGDEAAAKVRAHVAAHRVGEAWIRQGLEHAGTSCPFCAQSLDGIELIELYRQWFDRAYDDLASALVRGIDDLERLNEWWHNVKVVGGANRAAFDAWSDLPGFERPSFDSDTRRQQTERLRVVLRDALQRKQGSSKTGVDDSCLDEARILYSELQAAVTLYNSQVVTLKSHIDERLKSLRQLSADRLQSAKLQLREGFKGTPRLSRTRSPSARVSPQSSGCSTTRKRLLMHA